MAQLFNNSDNNVPAEHVVNDHPHDDQFHHSDEEEITEYREVVLDRMSPSDFDGMRRSGLRYGDHDYMGSNPNTRCPPEPCQFPVMSGLTDQYLNGETTEPTNDRPETGRHMSGITPLAGSSGSTIRKGAFGGTMFRAAKGEDFASVPGSSHFSNAPKPQSWQAKPNVTQPKKSGRPAKNDSREVPPNRLIGRAMAKAGMEHGHIQQQQMHPQAMPSMRDVGMNMHGTAPLITPGRGQKVTPRGRTAASAAAAPRQRLIEGIDEGYGVMQQQLQPMQHMQPIQHIPPGYRSISATSPRKQLASQFRSAAAAEEAHTREMMEAAQNALAPSNAIISGHAVMHHDPNIVLPPSQPSSSSQHYDDELPRTPGNRSVTFSANSSPSTRRHSESQEMHMIMQEPLRTNPDGLPMTPGGSRKTPHRSPRARMSTSESNASGSQSTSPRHYAMSPRQQAMHGGMMPPTRALPVSPSKQPMLAAPGSHIKPSSGPILHHGPSTMMSAQQQMTINSPLPSTMQQFHQTPPGQRQVGPSPPGRTYYEQPVGQAAPLVTGSGSNSYAPRKRKERDDEAIDAEVTRNVKNILDKSGRYPPMPQNFSPRREHQMQMEETKRIQHASAKAKEAAAAAAAAAENSKRGSSRRSVQKAAARKEARREEEEDKDEEEWIVDCICGAKENDDEPMVGCDNCIRWQHIACLFPRTKKPPDSFICTVCNPRETDISPAEARDFQERNRAEREREKRKKELDEEEETKRKLAERHKRKEENGRRPQVSAHRSIPSSKIATIPSYREISRNEYSNNAKRLFSVAGRGTAANAPEILNKLRGEPRVKTVVVTKNMKGLLTTKEIESGTYISELTGHISLHKEVSNRDATPIGSNDLTFLYETGGDRIVIDARKCGNDSRFVRRSCAPNAELQEVMHGNDIHIMITSTTDIPNLGEVTIPWEDDWKKRPRPQQECGCGKGTECEIATFFKSQPRMDVAPSRRSLPVNGNTPRGARSPIQRAQTEKRKGGSSKKVIAKKGGKRKGVIKLPRPNRKSKAGSATTAESTEGDDETEKEYEESTMDEKEEEEKEEKREGGRGRRKSERSEGKKEKEEEKKVVEEKKEEEEKEKKKEEESDDEMAEMPVLTATRSSTRIRNDSDAKREAEAAKVEEKKEVKKEEKKEKKDGKEKKKVEEKVEKKKEEEKVKEEEEVKEEEKEESVPATRRGRKSEMEKKKEEKEEEKKESSSSRTPKDNKPKKEWVDKMNYSLPSERNKESREERKLKEYMERIQKDAKKSGKGGDRKSGSSTRGRSTSTTTPTAAAAAGREERSSGRGKRKLEQEGESARADKSTAAASTPLMAPPRKRLAASDGGKKEEEKEKEKKEMSPVKEEMPVPSPVPASGKKKWIQRHNEEQRLKKAAEDAAAASKTENSSNNSTPSRPKRYSKKEEKGAVEALMNMGEGGGIREMMRRHAIHIRDTEKLSEFSLGNLRIERKRDEKPSTSRVEPPPEEKKEEKIEEKKKNLSLDEYKKRKAEGGGGDKKEGGGPKKNFMPMVDGTSSVPSSLPHVSLPGLDEKEMKKRGYGETPKKGNVSTADPRTPEMGSSEPAPKRQSINDRLRNEFSIPTLNATPLSINTTPAAAAAAATPSTLSPALSAGELTPSGQRARMRLSEARAMNVEPPGLMTDPPRPSSLLPSPASRPPPSPIPPSPTILPSPALPSSLPTTPSSRTSATAAAFLQRTAAIRK